MKRLTSSILLSVLALGNLLAQEASDKEVVEKEVVEIVFDETTASVTIPETVVGVTSTIEGANVSITSTTTTKEYAYRVSGSSTDGSLTITGKYKLTLQLNGLTLTNDHGGAAINVQCSKRISVVMMDGTVNTLSDSSFGEQKGALFFKGHPEFEGGGTLNVTGRLKHAICAKEYLELKSSTGIINILGAVSDGIHCGEGEKNSEHNYFLMKGGTVNIANVGTDGIDSDDYGTIIIRGGAVSVNVKDEGTALKADSILTISDGVVNLFAKGIMSEGIRASHTVNITGGKTSILVVGNGSKGIKTNQKADKKGATVINGGFLTISGGVLDIQAIGGNYIDEEKSDVTKCMGISVDADLEQSAGDVCITAIGPEANGYHVKGTETRSDGQFNVTLVPWLVMTYDYQYDMTAYVSVSLNDKQLPNYTKKAVGAFIGDECVGYALFEDPDYGVMRIRSNDISAQTVTFRLYDYNDKREYTLTPSTPVTFQSPSVVGEPSDPLVLSFSLVKGDANDDGIVTAADIVEVVNALTGEPSEKYKALAADVNSDDIVDIADVTGIANIITEQEE